MGSKIVLVIGFEPYGGRGLNPSAEVTKRIDGAQVQLYSVVGRTLPVSFQTLRQRIDNLLSEFEPAMVVGLGLWPGESVIRLERFAINFADFEIPDNEGILLQDTLLDDKTATAIPVRLPLRAIEEALLAVGIPARLSNSAGTFLCNATIYTLLQKVSMNVPCGFVHLPYLPAQVANLLKRIKQERVLELHQRADLASMSLDTMLEAVQLIIATTIANVMQTP